MEEYVIVEISKEEKNLSVCSYVTLIEAYDVILFLGKLSKEVCDCIMAMAPPNSNPGRDRIA